jgi:flagellar biosynthesis GTPase FlhF
MPAKDDFFSSTYLSTPSKQNYDTSLKNDVTDIIKNELESVKELLKNQQSENTNQDFDVKSELEGIKELLKAQVLQPATKAEENDQHSLHISMSRTLYQKRFQSMTINSILAQIPTDVSLDNAWKIFINQITDLLKFSKSELSTAKKIKTLIGPSGVGKTLLLAKILVYFANKPLKNNFAIIFVNNSNLKVLEETKFYERIFKVRTYYFENLDVLDIGYHKYCV